MTKILNEQVLASVLRALTLGSKFILLFYLATKLNVVQMGVFTLYWAGLQLSASLIPLDVYAQTTRLILEKNSKVVLNLQKHFGFLLLVIIFLGPIALYLNVSFGAKLDGLFFILFLVHLPAEVFATEISRLLVPLGKPLLSNFLNFIRSSAWILFVFLFFELNLIEISPVSVVSLWLVGSVLCVLLSIFIIGLNNLQLLRFSIDFIWIKAAISGGFLFLIGTLLFRSILGIDKFLVNSAYGEEVVAIYAIYSSGLLGVLALLESGISAWHYPRMVKSIRDSNFDMAKLQFKKFFLKNLLYGSFLFLVIFFVFPILVYVFLPSVYFNEISLFYVIAVGVVLYCFTMPFHYFIYGIGADKCLVLIYMLSLMFILIWFYVYMVDFGILGAGVMLSGALILISLLRVMFSFILFRKLF